MEVISNHIFTFVIRSFSLALALALFTGCLETRETVRENEEKQVMRKQLSTLQQTTADENERFQDVNDDIKKLGGKIEALENKQQQIQSHEDKSASSLDSKLKENDAVYREEFKKLSTEIDELRGEITQIIENQKRAAQVAAAPPADPFKAAQEKFENKSWKEAILDYEHYRKANPKGKNFGVATYKIGVAFQELGLSGEARAFYEEVISKFPKSKEAAKASAKLKSLKSKK